MSELILIIIAVILAAAGNYTMFWILGGTVVLILICSLFGRSKRKSASHEKPRTRIDIPHYFDRDEHVCTVCGHRFERDVMCCPHCGVRFNATRTDERAFIREEDEEDFWDELEEEGW